MYCILYHMNKFCAEMICTTILYEVQCKHFPFLTLFAVHPYLYPRFNGADPATNRELQCNQKFILQQTTEENLWKLQNARVVTYIGSSLHRAIENFQNDLIGSSKVHECVSDSIIFYIHNTLRACLD